MAVRTKEIVSYCATAQSDSASHRKISLRLTKETAAVLDCRCSIYLDMILTFKFENLINSLMIPT